MTISRSALPFLLLLVGLLVAMPLLHKSVKDKQSIKVDIEPTLKGSFDTEAPQALLSTNR